MNQSSLMNHYFVCRGSDRGGQKMGPYIWIPPSHRARYFTEAQNFEVILFSLLLESL